jgi:predicted HTH domain antitoxin
MAKSGQLTSSTRKSMTVPLTLPDDIAAELGADRAAVGARVQADLAVHYYEYRLVSLGRACELAGMRRQDFERALAQRGVVRDYAAEDWAVDLAWANSGR